MELLEAVEIVFGSGTPGNEPPPAKNGWSHTKQCLVWYKGDHPESSQPKVSSFGIAYYHYDPPFSNAHWTDYANYGRVPELWWPLPDEAALKERFPHT